MTFSAQQICETIQPLIIKHSNSSAEFTNIGSLDNFDKQSLIFISALEQSAKVDKQISTNHIQPSVIITTESVCEELSAKYIDICIICVRNVRLAQALVKAEFDDYDASDKEWPSIHPNATIHPSATFGENVRLGPNVVIGENVHIGSNTTIRSNSVVERNVVIGSDCIINCLVNIGKDCLIGNRVIIRPGVVIGNEGFGFAQCELGQYHRIPHTGTVEIQDDVQIGSNCNIDRGTYGKTLIGRGVKIDSLCHIAHNVQIGEGTLIVAQTGIAGSSTVGKKVVISGQSAIVDHTKVADGAVLVHRCGVTEDIPSAGMWAGTPAKPMKDYIRNLNPAEKSKRLERKLNEKINTLEERLAKLENKF